MSEAPLDPNIIKLTQDTLGQIINAPALTEKLLSRPPVQFLQDIIKTVVKKTNFLQGLYSDDELTPAYLKEGRDNKTLFMKKLVTAVYIAVKRPPDVRVSKILAGQEADKTNLLLQALAEAINSDVDNNEVVRKTLQTLGETNENEEPQRKEPEQPEKRVSTSSGDRVRTSKGERSSKSTEREEPPAEKKTSSREASKDQGDAEGSSHSKRRRSSRVNDDIANGTTEDRKASNAPKQDDDDDNDKKDDDDSSRRRISRPSSAKGPRKQQNNNNNNQQRPTSPKPDPASRQPPPPPPVATDRDNTDEKPLARPGTASAAKSRKPMKVTTLDEMSGSSGRVASAAQRGQGILIVESKDSRDNDMNGNNDDDGDDFLVQEEKPSLTKSFKQDDFDNRGGGGTGDQDDDEGDQHGALVRNMIASKKQLEHGSEIAGQRSDVKTIAQNDAQRRREREKIQKDVDKLRETIQSLTKSVVPLGKILEYLQEDYEMMAKEMQHYTDDYKRTIVELRKEKFTTDQSLEPLRAAMVDCDEQIVDMKNRIIFMKKKINTNEKANASRLVDIIRKTK